VESAGLDVELLLTDPDNTSIAFQCIDRAHQIPVVAKIGTLHEVKINERIAYALPGDVPHTFQCTLDDATVDVYVPRLLRWQAMRPCATLLPTPYIMVFELFDELTAVRDWPTCSSLHTALTRATGVRQMDETGINEFIRPDGSYVLLDFGESEMEPCTLDLGH
jgi:hypothetical protein